MSTGTDRRRRLPMLVLLALALAASASGRAAQWRLVDGSLPDSAEARSVGEFVTALTKTSRGSLSISAAPAAASTSPAQLLGDLSAGRIALATVPLSALEAVDPVMAMDRVPYLAGNFVDNAKLWSVLRPYVRDALQGKGITLLYAVPSAPVAPLSRKPLLRMSDWRGSVLVLDAPALGGFARSVGARTVPAGAARQLLGSDKAQVVFQSAPLAVRDKAWDYATHYLRAPAWFAKQLVLVGSRQLAALGAADRDAVLNAADAAQDRAWTASRQAAEDGVQTLRDYGIKTREPAVEVLIELETLGRGLLFQWSEKAGEIGAQLVESYYAIR